MIDETVTLIWKWSRRRLHNRNKPEAESLDYRIHSNPRVGFRRTPFFLTMGCASSKATDAADAAAPVTAAVTAPVEAPTPGVTGGMDGTCEIAQSV